MGSDALSRELVCGWRCEDQEGSLHTMSGEGNEVKASGDGKID